MNPMQKAARALITVSFKISVRVLESFSDMEPYHQKVNALRDFEAGTLGKAIADCLDAHDLTLVPHYESHDLKHVLLGYPMTAKGEIRLQAFMLGNGNYSAPSFAIFILGALFLPDLWAHFYADYKKGQHALPIASWTLEAYASQPLEGLRSTLSPSPHKTPPLDMKRSIQLVAIIVICTGVFGMLYCLPHLFSSNLADLVGAGFPFVGGAILVVGGLLALSNLASNESSPAVKTAP